MMPNVHPLRAALHHEVHARPYERLAAPMLLSHLALVGSDAAAVREHLAALLAPRHLPVPTPQQNHVSTDLGGGVRLRWEQHGEFHTCTSGSSSARRRPASTRCRTATCRTTGCTRSRASGWSGCRCSRAGGAPGRELPPLVRQCLAEDSLVGARVMDGAAEVYTDFRLQGDGYARWIVVAGETTPRRLGRLVQRLLEVETYRMMALLGLPVAREVGAALVGAERALADVADRIRIAQPSEEPELLRRLTELAAEVEGLYARTHARFSASAAYFELMQRRIEELREERVHNLQTLQEFMDRRLQPAMQTCAWAARRQALSERISRVSNLLRTRVEIEQQQSSRALLDAMNRRQKAQLLLQSAVEGLSVAAVTYYGAGLVGYLAKGRTAPACRSCRTWRWRSASRSSRSRYGSASGDCTAARRRRRTRSVRTAAC